MKVHDKNTSVCEMDIDGETKSLMLNICRITAGRTYLESTSGMPTIMLYLCIPVDLAVTEMGAKSEPIILRRTFNL
jgi:hypothetical protein